MSIGKKVLAACSLSCACSLLYNTHPWVHRRGILLALGLDSLSICVVGDSDEDDTHTSPILLMEAGKYQLMHVSTTFKLMSAGDRLIVCGHHRNPTYSLFNGATELNSCSCEVKY